MSIALNPTATAEPDVLCLIRLALIATTVASLAGIAAFAALLVRDTVRARSHRAAFATRGQYAKSIASLLMIAAAAPILLAVLPL
ncbi:hypothetical protein ACIRRA_39885 [Nocardia sp. NPDC101769]|uniref:hypothetical protein n=1 Tax=Nocardia sp. NPDC101769 TaxID=3364333 RepID=UPI00382BCAF6